MSAQNKKAFNTPSSVGHQSADSYQLPSSLTATMQNLYAKGFYLIPLGGDDGKKPLVKYKNRARFSLDFVMEIMIKNKSSSYGIRLGNLAVVDCDTDTPETYAMAEDVYGSSNFYTKTGRGKHFWFQVNGPAPSSIDTADIKIDIKSGANAHVVGPASIRPDGTIYSGNLSELDSIQDLPNIISVHAFNKEISATKVANDTSVKTIPEGSRNKDSYTLAKNLAPTCDTLQELIEKLSARAATHYENPETVTQADIKKVAKWAWDLKLKNSLFQKGTSNVVLHEFEYQAIYSTEKTEGALKLYMLLKKKHSAEPGKRFAIAGEAMAKEEVIKGWKHKLRYYNARDVLIQIGLLKQVETGIPRKSAHKYQFIHP